MKTYQLGTAGDRIVTVKKKSEDQLVVTVKVKDAANKFINLPPKRQVFEIFFTSSFSVMVLFSLPLNMTFILPKAIVFRLGGSVV